MDRKDRTTATSIKIPDGLLSKIDQDVNTSGDFSSRTDWILAAIRMYEEHRVKLLAERKISYSEDSDDFVSSSSESVQNNVNE